MSTTADLRYSPDHEWVRIETDNGDGTGIAVVGITAYAAEQLGDIVYVDLPAEGDSVSAGQVAGEIESTKSVGELVSPVDGVVVASNESLESAPELVNQDPYGEGWLVRVEFSSLPDLLDEAAYAALIQGSGQ